MNTRYVLLTAAKDEEQCIEDVIQLVVRQTIKPLAWLIIDDGSTDRTASIVKAYAAKHAFIHLHSTASNGGRNFGSQYTAIMAGYDLLKGMDFDFVGVFDADQAPKRSDYIESLLDEFHSNPRLGAASGYVYERRRGEWSCRPENSLDSLAASAMFRRSCFDQTGGYKPLYHGGSDSLIQLDAKIAGWEIMTRPDLPILHYRPTSSAGGIWRGRFRAGLMDASIGSHPVFEFFKCCRRINTHPVILGSAVRLCGYCWWKVMRREPIIEAAKVDKLRQEQLAKLRRWMTSSKATQIRPTNSARL